MAVVALEYKTPFLTMPAHAVAEDGPLTISGEPPPGLFARSSVLLLSEVSAIPLGAQR